MPQAPDILVPQTSPAPDTANVRSRHYELSDALDFVTATSALLPCRIVATKDATPPKACLNLVSIRCILKIARYQ
jgi:hypothetical protein